MTDTPPLTITREDTSDTKGRYLARVPGIAEAAEMTYSRAGGTRIIIDHTEVPEAMRGTGAGAALVARAVEDARAEGKKIMPLCPFAAAQFKKHPEYADVKV